MMKTALSVENLSKVYLRDKKKNSNINALNNITLSSWGFSVLTTAILNLI